MARVLQHQLVVCATAEDGGVMPGANVYSSLGIPPHVLYYVLGTEEGWPNPIGVTRASVFGISRPSIVISRQISHDKISGTSRQVMLVLPPSRPFECLSSRQDVREVGVAVHRQCE